MTLEFADQLGMQKEYYLKNLVLKFLSKLCRVKEHRGLTAIK